MSTGKFQPEKSFVSYLNAIKNKDHATLEKTWGIREKAAMQSLQGSLGGYLIPQDFSDQILFTLEEESFIRPHAQVIGMKTSQTYVPKWDVETVPTASGNSPFFGGLTFQWGLKDGTSLTEQDPAVRQIGLRAWDLTGYVLLSNQLLADITPTTNQYLLNMFGRAIAWWEEYAFLNGTGLFQPLGILNSQALVTQPRAVGSQIAAADIAGMASLMTPSSWRSAIWAASPTCLAQIGKIATYFLTGEINNDGYVGTLMGRPLYVTEKLPALGAQADLIFFDPRLYVIGDLLEYAVDLSPFTNFQTNQSAFRLWARVDGQPLVEKKITLADTSTTVSPYVALHV